jgi:hypothetical protein
MKRIRIHKPRVRGAWGALMRSCSSPVLVEQAAEQIASVYLALPAVGCGNAGSPYVSCGPHQRSPR